MRVCSFPAAVALLTMTLMAGCHTDSYTPNGPDPPSTTGRPEGGVVPAGFAIFAPYPNPFNPTTVIVFTVPVESPVLLVVQNPLGDVIETLVSQTLDPGYYSVEWDATKGGTRDLKSGLYFITLHAPGFTGSQLAKYEK